ncbi:hypothetical protein LY474_40515 [Myxococcus stipitatus]|uniref:hypothetical protein n=1 Tax=Myxococcus stipitatus TaxID=83455 RepID=UPI001F1DF5FB|nr:hypothetical protein [Myxococcus stipitatus]MCE9674092.1 hypothetical protein [Myxococcus stipitatus]
MGTNTSINNWDGRTLGNHRVIGRYWEAGKAMGQRFAHVFATLAPSGGAGVGVILAGDDLPAGWRLVVSTDKGKGPSRMMVEFERTPAGDDSGGAVSQEDTAGLADGLDALSSVMETLADDSAARARLAHSSDAAAAERLRAQLAGFSASLGARPDHVQNQRAPGRRVPVLLACAGVVGVAVVAAVGLLSRQGPARIGDVRPTVEPVSLTDVEQHNGVGGGGLAWAVAAEAQAPVSVTVRLPRGYFRDMPESEGPVVPHQAVPRKGKCEGSEVALRGACWHKGDPREKKDGKCPDDKWQWRGECYVPVVLESRSMRSGKDE